MTVFPLQRIRLIWCVVRKNKKSLDNCLNIKYYIKCTKELRKFQYNWYNFIMESNRGFSFSKR